MNQVLTTPTSNNADTLVGVALNKLHHKGAKPRWDKIKFEISFQDSDCIQDTKRDFMVFCVFLTEIPVQFEPSVTAN